MEYSWSPKSPLDNTSIYSFTPEPDDIQILEDDAIPTCSFSVLEQTFKDESGENLIVYLHPGQRIVFVGGVYVSVKKGQCNCLGYTMKPSNCYYPVVSPAWEPAVTIDSVETDSIDVADDDSEGIMSIYKPNCDLWETVLVLKSGVEKNEKSMPDFCIPGCYLIPQANEDIENVVNKKNINKLCHRDCYNPSLWNNDIDSIFNVTMKESSTFLTCGPRGSGKSTLQKILLNRLLGHFQNIIYIDTDLGQPEFSIEGFVSMYIINEPVLHPALSYRVKPFKSIYIGNNNAEESPSLYLKAIYTLYQLYTQHFSDQPLLVNTAGWVQGLGYNLLFEIYNYIKPNYTFCLMTQNKYDHYALPQISERCTVITLQAYMNDPTVSVSKAPLKRDYRLLSSLYANSLATVPLIAPELCEINASLSTILYKQMNTYKIDYRKLAIYCGDVLPSLFHKVLSGYIVGLSIYTDAIPYNCDYPYLLDAIPNIESKGYGIVRAVDTKQHVIYIISMIPMEDMKAVNCIVKGNRSLPFDCIHDNVYSIMNSIPYFSSRTTGKGAYPLKSRNNLKRFEYN